MECSNSPSSTAFRFAGRFSPTAVTRSWSLVSTPAVGHGRGSIRGDVNHDQSDHTRPAGATVISPFSEAGGYRPDPRRPEHRYRSLRPQRIVPEIDYRDHAEGAERLASHRRDQGFDREASDFHDGLGFATEDVTAIPHTGTHVDAP